MAAPKNYTVSQMEKDPQFAADVADLTAKNPLWSLREVRRIAAMRAFARKIRSGK